jgi:hypothetical protein
MNCGSLFVCTLSGTMKSTASHKGQAGKQRAVKPFAASYRLTSGRFLMQV